MLIYPSILPQNGQAFNLISNNAYNPKADILLSIEYCISGNENTEAGVSFFLLSAVDSFIGGVSGTDLCYSGFYNNSLEGIRTGVIGVGFDSTGTFGISAGRYYSTSNPLSSSLSASYRDGYSESDIIPNSIAVRGDALSLYALSSFNYYRAVSSVNLIDSEFQSRYLRFRLGNVARTIYLDYKGHFDEIYQNIATINIGEYIDITKFYRVGMGFTTPVSSNNALSIANFYFKKIHIEGLYGTLIEPDCNLSQVNIKDLDYTPACFTFGTTLPLTATATFNITLTGQNVFDCLHSVTVAVSGSVIDVFDMTPGDIREYSHIVTGAPGDTIIVSASATLTGTDETSTYQSSFIYPEYCIICDDPATNYATFTTPEPSYWDSHRDWAWPTYPDGVIDETKRFDWTSSPTPLSSTRDMTGLVCFPEAGIYKLNGFALDIIVQGTEFANTSIKGITLLLNDVVVASLADIIGTGASYATVWQPEFNVGAPGSYTFKLRAIYSSDTGSRSQGNLGNNKFSYVGPLP